MTKPLNYPKRPQIYVYSVPGQPGYKIGYTERVTKSRKDYDAVKQRIEEGLIKTPNPQYKIEHYELAVTDSGEYFMDHLVHKWLRKIGVKQLAGEWYDAPLEKIKSVIHGIKTGRPESSNDKVDFKPRPEQEKFIEETAEFFRKNQNEKDPPRYLWNAKMRFGKTFTAYELAKKMGWKRILVLTYKAGVEKEWQKDLYGHQDFNGWQFIEGLSSWEENSIDESRPVVWFASYQDVLVTKDRSLKERHRKMREIDWDCIYVDEYHFGAWREAAKELGQEEKKEETMPEDMDETDEIETILPLKTRGYLYLSGTPFRALTEGEFNEDQISNWTYSMEQEAKRNWHGEGLNPYADLPQIVMLTYKMPDSLREIAQQGEFDEFDLNKFFKAKKTEDGKYIFEHEKEVQKFLNILRGNDLDIAVENSFDYRAPALPFEDSRLLSTLRHTFWFLPSVPACKAMEDMLKNDPFYSNYTIIRAAGNDTPGGKEAKEPVENAIGNGMETATITLSCGKLTTGVTIPAWSGVLFLRNTDKPETYFQTAFRAQSPWVAKDADDPAKRNILKVTCYVLDFAPTRALRLVADYSDKLSVGDKRKPEERLEEFIRDLPILCFDGGRMTPLKADDVLDIANYGTASTMLARRWQNARLIDTSTVVLEKAMNNPEIMAALEKIEGFRNLRGELSRIITREKEIQKKKRKRAVEGMEPTPEEKKEEDKEKKERQSFKKKLREKLLQFATRVPVFMYLTDYREEALTDVIRNLEPEMFTKVTGLSVREFDLMCEVGVFNQTEMNQAIAQFRRFEDKSLEYLGGRSAHEGGKVGLFDTTVSDDEIDEIIMAEK